MKTCGKCHQVKEFKFFYKKSESKGLLAPHCVVCTKEYRKAYYNNTKIKSINYSKTWRSKNKESYQAYNLEYKQKHPSKYRNYYKKNGALRKSFLLKATPPWLSKIHKDLIVNFYMNCPEGHEVDHIVPLRGKTVNGLHVPWNLQYLTKSENCRKSNKL